MSTSHTRRRFLGSAAGISVAALAHSHRAGAQEATPLPSPEHHHGAAAMGTAPLLAVADQAAELLSIYTLPDYAFAGSIEGIAVSSHAGMLPLANGNVLFMDEAARRLVEVGLAGGVPEILHEVHIDGHVAHIAVDSDHAHYAAVGTSAEDPAQVTLVDLETWEPAPVVIPNSAEVGVMMNHDALFHRNSKLHQVEAYLLDELLSGKVEPVSTVQLGTFGHGEAITLAGDTLYCATDDGIDVVTWDGVALQYDVTWPWHTDPAATGRGYFTRLSFDGAHLVTYSSDRSAPEPEWPTSTNVALVYDTTSGELVEANLGAGYTFRFSLARDRALFSVIGGEDDEAIVLNLAPDRENFGQISQRIALTPMTSGPVEGTSIYETGQYRATAITADGRTGFVTQGGDGIVTVLDLAAGTSSATIETPGALDGGGSLLLFGGDTPFVDTIGR